MNIIQTPYFRRAYKKLHKNEVKPVNQAIRFILDNPSCGEEKRGGLAGTRVYKFRVNNQQFLLAYEYSDDNLLLLALGSHENFYRGLKR